MPRIRIRTPGEKRVVGTPNGSTLTVESVAIAQRASLQLPAEAKLTGGGTLLEHWVWEFAELDEHARIDLIAEPGDTFDPPAASGCASRPNRRPYRRNQMAQLQQVERELAQLAGSMHKLRLVKPPQRCGFCGRDKVEVKTVDRRGSSHDLRRLHHRMPQAPVSADAGRPHAMHSPRKCERFSCACGLKDPDRLAWLQGHGEGIIQMHISRPANWLERGKSLRWLPQRPLEESQRTHCPGNPRLHGSIVPDSFVSMHTTRSGQISRPERS